jgi:hypothetical protein
MPKLYAVIVEHLKETYGKLRNGALTGWTWENSKVLLRMVGNMGGIKHKFNEGYHSYTSSREGLSI